MTAQLATRSIPARLVLRAAAGLALGYISCRSSSSPGWPSSATRFDNAKLPDVIAKRVAFTKDGQAKLLTPNYDYIAKNDAALKEWWDKTFKG
jgi:hypothetical protein